MVDLTRQIDAEKEKVEEALDNLKNAFYLLYPNSFSFCNNHQIVVFK